MAFNLASFIRYLGHSHIAVKSIKTGERGAQESHFRAIDTNKAEDYIALRNGKHQIWINLQKLKPDVGRCIKFADIESYKNIYIDLDCNKPKELKDYAATEEERAEALSQVPILRTWLESHGFICGLELRTGNGAGMVLPIPETKAEPVFIAKLATFLKMAKADIPNVDSSCFDPPRVIGIPGTINAKLEAEGRKNHVREIVGDIPTRVEDQVLLDFINAQVPDQATLKEWGKKYGEPQAQSEADRDIIDAEDIIDRLTGLYEYEKELKTLLDGNIDRFEGDRSAAEYGVCGRLVKFGFTDVEIDFIMCKVSKIGKWREEGPHYRFEQTLRKLREAEEIHCDKPKHDDIKIPKIQEISIDDTKNAIGLNPNTGAICEIAEIELDGGNKKRFLRWVSDCAVHIYMETHAGDETEFIFIGEGAVDNRPVKFTMKAGDVVDGRKFKAALTNAFGAKNRVGGLTFEKVQQISLNPRLFLRVEAPAWDGKNPLLPGVNLVDNVEYRLSPKIPAAVYDGDLDRAKDILRILLKVHKFVVLLVTVVLGAPAIARWHKNDRFALGLWGLTGTLKTSTVLAALAMFGIGYLDGPKLKAGKDGSTSVGAMEVFAASGFLAQLYDNLKAVIQKDIENYVGTMHAVLEGEEKARGRKDRNGLRDSREFQSTPIVTGEVRPQEASTTARGLNLNWTQANGKLLAEVQAHAALLPVIGYYWLRFLAGTNFVLGKDFEAFRTQKMQEFLDLKYTNPGRLATIYTLLVSTWDLLEESPLGDVFTEARESFKTALEEAITTQGAAISEETEISRFLSGLEELLAANPGLIMSKEGKKTIMGSIIGKWMPDGIFLLPSETLNELTKIKVFTQQPTSDSITQALHEKGLLVPGEKGRLKNRQRIGEGRAYGWYIKWSSQNEDVSPSDGDAKNDNNRQVVPVGPGVLHEKQKLFYQEKIEDSKENQKHFLQKAGDSEDSEDRKERDKDIDIDFINRIVSPVVSPVHSKIERKTPSKKIALEPKEPLNDGVPGQKFCVACGEDLIGHALVEMGGRTYCARPGCGYPARDEGKAT